jgi:hypothetical protein
MLLEHSFFNSKLLIKNIFISILQKLFLSMRRMTMLSFISTALIIFIFLFFIIIFSFRTNFLMQVLRMLIPLKRVSFIITRTSITTGLTRSMIYAAYYELNLNSYDLTFFCSCVHYLLFLMSMKLWVRVYFINVR